jgi:hypothetical protein
VGKWVHEADVERYARSLVPAMEALGRSPLGTIEEVLDFSIPTGELPRSLDELSYGELKAVMGRLITTLYGEDVDPIDTPPLREVSITLLHQSIELSIRKREVIERNG